MSLHEITTKHNLIIAEKFINDEVPTETQSEINQFDEVFDLPLSNLYKEY